MSKIIRQYDDKCTQEKTHENSKIKMMKPKQRNKTKIVKEIQKKKQN